MPSLRSSLIALAALVAALTTAAPSARAQDMAPVSGASAASAEAAFDDEDDYDDYASPTISDPIEGFNRRVFAFNDWAYTRVITPTVKGYELVVRPPLNRAIGNFYDNARYPVRLVNSLLQGKVRRADLETRKFVVNTLGGLGGFIRQSENVPLLARLPREDFGQTLGVWGVPHGPYVVLPILGGSSLRDVGGRAVDSVVSPTGWEYIDLGNREWVNALSWEWQTAITVTDTMSSLPFVLELYAEMRASALDPYLSVRDATRRYRDAATAR